MVAMTGKSRAAVTLPSETQIRVVREFDAPRRLVYKAWTTPELIRRWWSGDRGQVTHAEVDLRVGGTWRYVMVSNEGHEVAFRGEFREIVPEQRIVSTEIYEAMAEAGATLNTATFEEVGGRTQLTLIMDCPSQEVRDGIIGSGMEDGLQEALDHLEQVARSLVQA
jgi:uncharacterized protein YndB with AHSA1/START domain